MKTSSWLTLTLAAILLAGSSSQAQEWRDRARARIADARAANREKYQEIVAKVRAVRALGAQFRDAVIAKDNDQATQLLTKFKSAYAALPENVKEKIEQKRPGTREKMATLTFDDVNEEPDDDPDNAVAKTAPGRTATQPAEMTKSEMVKTASPPDNTSGTTNANPGAGASPATQGPDRTVNAEVTVTGSEGGSKTVTHQGTVTKTGAGQWQNSGTTTGPGGHTWTNEGTTTRSGNTISHEGVATNDRGEVVQTREGVITREGNTLSREATVTNTKTGDSRTVDATFTKEGNTVEYEKTITTSNGKTITSEGNITRDGNTLTKEGTTTGPGGKTFTTTGTLTKEGSTITGHSETVNDSGEVVRTKDGVSAKDGNTRTTEVDTKWKNGSEKKQTTTTTRDGNAINRDTATTRHRGGGVKYNDDLDIFGSGFKKRNHPATSDAGRAAKTGSGGGGRK